MRNLLAEALSFCSAISSICDNRVKVLCDGGACTDGNTIHLPAPHQIATADGLAVIKGIACHEAAHIYYGTPPHHRAFASSYLGANRQLAADCYNAVADIADESRFEKHFRLARSYFRTITTHAAVTRLIFPNGNLQSPELPLTTATDVLVAAMLKTRLSRVYDPSARFAIDDAMWASPVVAKCVTVLRSSMCKNHRPAVKRTVRQWGRLNELAVELVSILSESGLPQTESTGERSDSVSTDVLHDPKNPATPLSDPAEVLNSDNTNAGQSDVNTDASAKSKSCADELDEADSPPDSNMGDGGPMAGLHRQLISDATDGKVNAIGKRPYSSDQHEMEVAAAPDIMAVFRRHAKQLLCGPKPIVSMPSYSGPSLGDVSRWRIDGKVLLRRVISPDIGTAVAVILDCSSSIEFELPHLGALASSLAQALAAARGNVACWHFGDMVFAVPVRRMHRVRLLGGTRTHFALAAAREWLIQQADARRVLCMFTDGEPNCEYSCALEVGKCRRAGIKVLVGLVNCSRAQLLRSMPGAETFEIGNNFECGFHQAIRRIAK